MALIWPDDAPEEASHKLRQSLYALRRQLGAQKAAQSDIFLATRTTIQLDSSLFTTDALQFEETLQAAIQCAGHCQRRSRFLQEAATLYPRRTSSRILLGRFRGWSRRRLAEQHRSVHHALMLNYENVGDLKSAIAAGCRVLDLDPLTEEAHCDLMRLYAADGQPSAVTRQYQALASTLRKQLGQVPLDSTRTLMESLRRAAQLTASSRIQSSALPAPTAVFPEGDNTTATEPLHHPVYIASGSASNPRWLRISVRPALTALVVAICCVVIWDSTLHGIGRVEGLGIPASASSRLAAVPTVPHTSSSASANQTPSDHAVIQAFQLPARQPSLVAVPLNSLANTNHTRTGSKRLVVTSAAPDADLNKEKQIAPPFEPGKTPGKVLWTALYEPHARDKSSEAVAVATDSKDYIYVTGFVDTVDRDVDILTLKYDEFGKLLWQERYNGPGNDVDRGVDIAVDDKGNVYVTGESDNGKGNGETRLAGLDFVTIKYDASGNQIWAKRYNGPDDGEDRPVRLKVDNNGVYVLGKSWGHDKTGKVGFDYALVKYDLEGKFQWDYRYDGGAGDDGPVDMALGRDAAVSTSRVSHRLSRLADRTRHAHTKDYERG